MLLFVYEKAAGRGDIPRRDAQIGIRDEIYLFYIPLFCFALLFTFLFGGTLPVGTTHADR